MTCNSDCQNSRHDRCRCSCGGANHGKAFPEFGDSVPGEKFMSPSMGGEIAKVFEQVANKKMICLGPCHQVLEADNLVGYPHDGGHADEDGNKWWLYVKCEKCGYATAVWKIIKNQIPAYEQRMKVVV